jgi:hypothetical protein
MCCASLYFNDLLNYEPGFIHYDKLAEILKQFSSAEFPDGSARGAGIYLYQLQPVDGWQNVAYPIILSNTHKNPEAAGE